MLEKAIINAKDKAALSWWCESIPLYIIAASVIFEKSISFREGRVFRVL